MDRHEGVHASIKPGTFPVAHRPALLLPRGVSRHKVHGPSGTGEPKHPQMPSLLASDLSKTCCLQSRGPHIPFPTSVASVPFALGPAPDPGNILPFPELHSLLQFPSMMGILNKCFLSQDHLISSSSPMTGTQKPKGALCSLLILNLLSLPSQGPGKGQGDGQRSC